MDDGFKRKLRALRTLCQDIVELRRGDHFAERLRLDVERFAEANKDDEVRALKAVFDETDQWPEVRQAFKNAFALYRQRKTAKSPAATEPAVA